MLPKYWFEISMDEDKPIGSGKMVPIQSSGGYLALERNLLPEDAVSYHSCGNAKAGSLPNA